MPLPGNVVERRARLVVRLKLSFDLLLAVALYLNGAPLALILAPLADALLLWPYLRYLRRAPAVLTLSALTLSAGLLALLPFGLGATGAALWVLYPLLPLGAGFVLGRRKLLWQMAVITTLVAAVAALPLLSVGEPLVLDRIGVIVFLAALAGSTWAAAWLAARTLRREAGAPDILGEPLTVVRGVLVAPFNWVVGGVPAEALRLELHELKRRHNPRWVVLDLGPAGELGRHDLSAIERAASDVSSSYCAIVLARPPADALGHLDVGRPVVGRAERFATLAQAVEAGLRRLGWSQDLEQPGRVVTKR